MTEDPQWWEGPGTGIRRRHRLGWGEGMGWPAVFNNSSREGRCGVLSSRVTIFIRSCRWEWSWRNFNYLLNTIWTPPFSEITSEPWLNGRANEHVPVFFSALHPCLACSTQFPSPVASFVPPFHSVLAWWILNRDLVCFESQRIMCPKNAVH